MAKDKVELVNGLTTQGTQMPCADLIDLFDIAVKENCVDMSVALKDIGAQNARQLNEMFNTFTAKKHQHESSLTTKETDYPELDTQVKKAMVTHLKTAYDI